MRIGDPGPSEPYRPAFPSSSRSTEWQGSDRALSKQPGRWKQASCDWSCHVLAGCGISCAREQIGPGRSPESANEGLTATPNCGILSVYLGYISDILLFCALTFFLVHVWFVDGFADRVRASLPRGRNSERRERATQRQGLSTHQAQDHHP
jgi:hypothetical protein